MRQNPGGRGSAYAWLVAGLLWFVALLNYMDRQMLSTMKSSMMVDILELEKAENFGKLMAVFLWIYGFMSPVAGLIADRINRKWLIVASLFIWSGVTFSMPVCMDRGYLFRVTGGRVRWSAGSEKVSVTGGRVRA